ncbi:MAG: hypothetical protein ABFR05_03075 [Bacteroidota bacterium]
MTDQLETGKKKKLIIGILFDLIGMSSLFFPVIDIVWAPLSAYLMTRLYKGNVGKIGGIVSFVEEAIPGLDFFPSFTITWLYVYILKKGKTS